MLASVVEDRIGTGWEGEQYLLGSWECRTADCCVVVENET